MDLTQRGARAAHIQFRSVLIPAMRLAIRLVDDAHAQVHLYGTHGGGPHEQRDAKRFHGTGMHGG